MKVLQFSVKTVLIAGLFIALTAPCAAAETETCFPVMVRNGSTQICAAIHENPSARRWGSTILAIHGFTETAAMWQGMAQAFFDDDVFEKMVKRVIAIDLPGRGSSPAPANLDGGPYGNLLVDDNVGIIIQAISALDAQGLGPNVIMGHSMGGLEIQATQEALLAQGSSLAHMGVHRAILLAPVPVPGSIWNQPPPSDLSEYVVETPEYGQVLAIPPIIGLYTGGFTNLEGELVPTAPSPEEMGELVGWEPILAALQLSDQLLPDIPRPDAREGAFSPRNGTLLTVVGFSQDILVPADDLDDLYEYLTGLPGSLYHRIDSPYAVHSMCITEPEVVVEELRSLPAVFR